ncbi:hypothetical protein, unlikely [Trypanosoma brucei gambiense DAL972]|uniref:Uncharacterized protein n=1 Tax=Trypanosoma brucei gambiense (strain MHOM/CI/86/DAL972) TaxID=679716 RepID=C9ZJW0_TRYB9|nr:hypothetical protein, unlikely [Trypanosoma brucei gambiense DAL972]CBH09724.1 hypothetical protein, unlikely [Trypanosoma brucei gambiense DAL972]|eukprot:XP_011772017.1 hypothetical protein, unlikely [Trypanosoma brucei gambiense DAL972]
MVGLLGCGLVCFAENFLTIANKKDMKLEKKPKETANEIGERRNDNSSKENKKKRGEREKEKKWKEGSKTLARVRPLLTECYTAQKCGDDVDEIKGDKENSITVKRKETKNPPHSPFIMPACSVPHLHHLLITISIITTRHPRVKSYDNVKQTLTRRRGRGRK